MVELANSIIYSDKTPCSTFGGIGFNHNVANTIMYNYNTTTTIEVG